ncbi:MAG: hypothetical protein WDA22_17310 [Bacteroidota bacterium]
MDTLIFTVLGGILVYVIGQIILTRIIIPSQELKKTLSGISNVLLLHQAKLANASFDKEISSEIKSKSAEVVSKTHVILWFAVVRLVFGLPSLKNIMSASRQLNLLSYNMLIENNVDQRSSRSDFAFENINVMRDIGRLLSIKTSYGEK